MPSGATLTWPRRPRQAVVTKYGPWNVSPPSALVVHFRHALRHEAFSESHERVALRVVMIGLFAVGGLTAVESARTIDRLRLQGGLTTDEAAARVRAVNQWLEAFDLVLVRRPVLSRASEPMPLPLGTLDAIHLATALIWRDRIGPISTMATHDSALGIAARAFGFEVRGV